MPTLGPTHPSRQLPVTVTGAHPGDVGTLTHALVATHADLAAWISPDRLGQLLTTAANDAVTAATTNQRQVLVASAVGYARRYLQAMAPADPWTLVGAEVPLGDGVADVVWRHTVHGWHLVDELKTTRVIRTQLDRSWVDQCRAYAGAATAEYGPSTIGVRLLPLATPALTVLVRTTGRPQPIFPTPEAPTGARLDGRRQP